MYKVIQYNYVYVFLSLNMVVLNSSDQQGNYGSCTFTLLTATLKLNGGIYQAYVLNLTAISHVVCYYYYMYYCYYYEYCAEIKGDY